jgi:delta-aminolevulinic acid dehydratase/porphobilinogen synthase
LVKDKDLKLISGIFLDNNIPHNKLWLKKYFRSYVQINFLSYMLVFDSAYYFCRHTGVKCSLRYIKKMKSKYKFLLKSHEEAKKNFNLDLLVIIENGKFKCGI